jgi:acetyltransferase-like isoleucine patch superfamily enzyme
MTVRKTLNTYISRMKGETYMIDDGVPPGYLLRVVLSRIVMKLRGRLLFIRRAHYPFVGGRVTIRCKGLISFGQRVSIADHVYIDALSSGGIRLGNNVSIGKATKIECTGSLRFLGKGLEAGDNVGLGADNFYGCAGGITIGQDTIVGNYVSFHAENHIYSGTDVPIRLQGVTHQGIRIGSNCWIGAKSTILDGAVIEDGCVIAAGALVIAGVYKENGIYGGVPAKLLKGRLDA